MNIFYPFHHKGLQENLLVSAVLRVQGGARDVGATDYHITLELAERTEVICLHATQAEEEVLEKEAGERGLSLSEYLCYKILGAENS